MQSAVLRLDGVQADELPAELRLTQKLIFEFHDWLVESGLPVKTADSYEQALRQISKRLPKDKVIRRGTLQAVREQLLEEGYAPATINLYICTANRLVEYCGRRELQVVGDLPSDNAEQPELTRAEYLKLLDTARRLGKRREYLLIKLFATTGISTSEAAKLTPAMVRQGEFEVYQNRVYKTKRIPPSLRSELLDYAQETGRVAGPIFISQGGGLLSRNTITVSITALAKSAGLPKEKCNPLCLRKLYHATRQEITQQFESMIDKTFDDVVDKEQIFIGWNKNS